MSRFADEAQTAAIGLFDAWRRYLDEILIANFMVFHDVVRDTPYDLWIGDEAWEVDHFLHENPELKTAPYAFLTDFVGWLPMPHGRRARGRATADHNAGAARAGGSCSAVRDAALFVGDPDDVVPDAFGPGLPSIRAWTERHFTFTGHITGFEPAG